MVPKKNRQGRTVVRYSLEREEGGMEKKGKRRVPCFCVEC